MPFFDSIRNKRGKVTTALAVLLVLFAVTISISVAILLYRFTGNREEFRISGIALEIFVGMYLFRVLELVWMFGCTLPRQ